MKTNKISIVMLSALAAVAGAFTSCSSEDDNALLNQPEKENQLRTLTVNAGIDNGGTRVTLDENDETKVLWTAGDQIELVCEGYADTCTFSLPEDFTGNAATATFEGAYNPEWTWEEGNEPYFQYPTKSMLRVPEKKDTLADILLHMAERCIILMRCGIIPQGYCLPNKKHLKKLPPKAKTA